MDINGTECSYTCNTSQELLIHGITLEPKWKTGGVSGTPLVKNVTKTPVAERAVRELRHELLCQDPIGGAPTPLTFWIEVKVLIDSKEGNVLFNDAVTTF